MLVYAVPNSDFLATNCRCCPQKTVRPKLSLGSSISCTYSHSPDSYPSHALVLLYVLCPPGRVLLPPPHPLDHPFFPPQLGRPPLPPPALFSPHVSGETVCDM